MNHADKFVYTINKLGFNFLKVLILIGIIMCILGIRTYLKDEKNEMFMKSSVFTILIIIIFIISKIILGAC